jgi:hypothetical protein
MVCPKRCAGTAKVILLAMALVLRPGARLAAQGGSDGDLEIVDFSFVNSGGGVYDISLDFFDNLHSPTTIGILVQKNTDPPVSLDLTCQDVPGDMNTCAGGTGTCSGLCPRRTYAEFPGKTFAGSCAKPRLGLQLCSCTNYRVQHKLGVALPLALGDQVTVTLDPDGAYDEASESNNSAIRTFGLTVVSIPTLGSQGLVLLVVLLALTGILLMIRRAARGYR